MKEILVIGAGRSSSSLINYLVKNAGTENWNVSVADADLQLAESKIAGSAAANAVQLDAGDQQKRKEEIGKADLVISMLPASMHLELANDCIELGKNLITPSYASDEMWMLGEDARKKGILILNEMGVDPGIDHMSAMKIIHGLQTRGAELESFESYTGGLIAPASDNNPWHYKITWNPRNVVLAGAGGTARYLENNTLKFIPYHKLFERITPIQMEGHGMFEGYANRDSLKYRSIYGIEKIPTLIRGTLRKGGFCEAWNALVQLGLTDDSFEMEHPEKMTWRQLTSSFLKEKGSSTLEKITKSSLQLSKESYEKLKWLGLFEEKPLNIEKGSPAVALQKLIEEKWKLDDGDKDMIVMWHRFRYQLAGKKHELVSSLIVEGDDSTYTAMAKTVGLPIAIAAKRILRGELKQIGIQLPVIADIYEPILEELAEHKIIFTETHRELK